MVSSTSGYGVYQPAAQDPFPIESVLAKIVGENNVGNAANLLGQYHVQNNTAQGNYDYAMQGQHDFAQRQLAAQIADNYTKHMLDAAKTPGGLSLLNAPNAGGPGGGIDPNLARVIETGLARAQNADILNKSSGGVEHLVSAGFTPSTEQVTEATGGMSGPRGTPLSTVNAQIAANARTAAAAIAASQVREPSVSQQVQMPYGPANVTFSGKTPESARNDWLAQHGAVRTNSGTNLPPAPLPPEAEKLRQRGGGSPNTSAPPPGAAPPPPGPDKQMTPAPQNEAPGVAEFQSTVIQMLPRYEHLPVGQDIRKGMDKNGGKPIVKMGSDGKLHPVGASGQEY